MRNKSSKLILKGLTNSGEPLTKEIHTLDEVKNTGNYTVICRHASTNEGLPNINGCTETSFCCEAQLMVTSCYSENESQSDTAYGQTLTISDRDTGSTATYIRTNTPIKNNGKWSEWQMVATGDIGLISQNNDINKQLSTLVTEHQAEVTRAIGAEGKLDDKITNISGILDFTADYTVSIMNGTQGNGGNIYAVRTSKKLQGEAGKTYTLFTDRPVDDGCKYIYGYATYKSLEGAVYENYSRFVDYGKKSTINHLTLQKGEVGFNFVITQFNEITEEYVPLRATSFNNYSVKIITSNKTNELQNSIENVANAIIPNQNVALISGSSNETVPAIINIPNSTLDLGESAILVVGNNSYILKDIHPDNPKKYRNISLKDKNGSATTATKLVFNSTTKELYCVIYTKPLADDEVLIGGIRLGYGTTPKNIIANLPFAVEYVGQWGKTPIYTRNLDKVTKLAAMCQLRKLLVAPYKNYQLLLCPDVHTDNIALVNAIDALNSFETLDALFFLGDITGSFFEPKTIKTFNDLCTKTEKPFYTVVGNHDVGNAKYIGACATHEQIYESFIKPMVDAGHLSQGEYIAGIPYWYHDNTTHNIRLIGLYEYDDPMNFEDEYWEAVPYSSSYPNIVGNTSYDIGDYCNAYVFGNYSDRPSYTQYSFKCKKTCTINDSIYNSPQAPNYKIQRGMRVIRETQAQWFLDTLAGTPADYTVIVALHNPFSDIAKSIESKFSQEVGIVSTNYSQNCMLTDFIANAVNAFVCGEKYNEKIVMKGDAAYMNTLSYSGTNYAYEVSKDFTNKKPGVKFGCFIGGHTHRDFVWKHPTYNLYQITPLCATTNISNTIECDICRTEYDSPAKDSLTAVSITDDRISLAKIGVNITKNATTRDCEVIVK